ncbi:hypothetical protein BDV93DRAFT_516448, partial [Ceratobasidium sp. AG-I]
MTLWELPQPQPPCQFERLHPQHWRALRCPQLAQHLKGELSKLCIQPQACHALPGDETLAHWLYDQQWDNCNEDHKDQLNLKDQLWCAERDARQGKKGKGKVKTKALMGLQMAPPPGAEGLSSQPLAHSVLLRPPPPCPTTPGDLMLEISSLFKPRSQKETGEAMWLQHLLKVAPMPANQNNQSFTQNQIQRAMLAWSASTNLLVTRGKNRLGGFQPGGPIVQMFFNQLQQINTARELAQGQGTRPVPAFTQVIQGILMRPGRYDELVELMALGVYNRNAASTLLHKANTFDFSHFREPENITEQAVASNMWHTLRIPRAAAVSVLQPS